MSSYSGHHPLGNFNIAPGQIQVSVGQMVQLVCSTNLCQVVTPVQSSNQQQANQQGQPTQQLNQPVPVGQVLSANNDNNDNGNDNNSNSNDNNDNNNDNNDNNDNNGNDNNDND